MGERISNLEAHNQSNEVINFLYNAKPFKDPNSKVWDDFLDKIGEKINYFKFSELIFNSCIFIPKLKQDGQDEEIMVTPARKKGISPVLQWISLRKNTSETKIMTTVMMNAPHSKPQLTIVQDIFSIFRVNHMDIETIEVKNVPNLEWQSITITDSPVVKFEKIEKKPIENIELPVEEALKRFVIPD